MGFGLAVGHRNVDNYGGSLSVNSRLGEWTEFRFNLPLAIWEKTRSLLDPFHTSQPVEILIVDDEPQAVKYFKKAFGAKDQSPDGNKRRQSRISRTLRGSLDCACHHRPAHAGPPRRQPAEPNSQRASRHHSRLPPRPTPTSTAPSTPSTKAKFCATSRSHGTYASLRLKSNRPSRSIF